MFKVKPTPRFIRLGIAISYLMIYFVFQSISNPKLFSQQEPLEQLPSIESEQSLEQENFQLMQLEVQNRESFRPFAKTVDFSKQKFHYRDKVIILTYHHIDPKEHGITITPERFKSHIQMLQQNDYNVISMEQLFNFMKNKGEVPQNAVIITFDDGYESVYTYAYPELIRNGFVATIFIVIDSIDTPDPNRAPRLKWDQIREMKKNGMSFYSHTFKLHDKVKVDSTFNLKPSLANRIYLQNESRIETEDEYRNRIKNDLILAEKRIREELGEQKFLLAFPFGAYNSTVISLGKELGIELFFTIKEGIASRGKDEMNRVNAGVHWLSADGLLKTMKKYENDK